MEKPIRFPWVKDGKFIREVQLRDDPLPAELFEGVGESDPEVFVTKITHGDGAPYAIDTVELPLRNPWHVPVMGSGLAMLGDGSALLATMHGDVWKVENLAYPSKEARWTRFATGLHQPLGVHVDEDGIFVQCRDQLVRLWDLDDYGDADFYECFSDKFETSTGGHDYICGLERDADGNFYTVSGPDGVYKVTRRPDSHSDYHWISKCRRDRSDTGWGFDYSVCRRWWTPAGDLWYEINRQVHLFGFRGPRNGSCLASVGLFPSWVG